MRRLVLVEVRFVWTSHGTDCGTSCDDSFVLACGDAWLQCDATELVLVDGVLPLRPWTGPQRTIVRGDSSEASIAAASVLAKQARDALIRRLAERFPGYALERHAGYGTAQHRAALLASGATSMHRHSFLTKVFAGV